MSWHELTASLSVDAAQVNSAGMYDDNIDEKSRVSRLSSEEEIHKMMSNMGAGFNLDQ